MYVYRYTDIIYICIIVIIWNWSLIHFDDNKNNLLPNAVLNTKFAFIISRTCYQHAEESVDALREISK